MWKLQNFVKFLKKLGHLKQTIDCLELLNKRNYEFILKSNQLNSSLHHSWVEFNVALSGSDALVPC
jgi:hypothetical protein